MKVCCTGDFHGRTPPEIPDCDLVLFAGDLGLHPSIGQMYYRWLDGLMERLIPVVGIAGNHDFNSDHFHRLPWMYLENNVTTIAGEGTNYVRVFGTPLSPPFNNSAHMRPETELEKVYAQIPDDIDIIVSHGPPHGYGDQVRDGLRVGSEALAKRIMELPNLKLVACGHIHEGYGQYGGLPGPVVVVNGSWVNERYEPGNPPILVDLVNDVDLRTMWPEIAWDTPITVNSAHAGVRYACRYCIALYGLKGSDLLNLWQTANEVLEHIEAFHPPTSTATGGMEHREGEPSR